jgi:hypothetical protein
MCRNDHRNPVGVGANSSFRRRTSELNYSYDTLDSDKKKEQQHHGVVPVTDRTVPSCDGMRVRELPETKGDAGCRRPRRRQGPVSHGCFLCASAPFAAPTPAGRFPDGGRAAHDRPQKPSASRISRRNCQPNVSFCSLCGVRGTVSLGLCGTVGWTGFVDSQ